MPLCTSTYNVGLFASYNAVCTMCNLLFVIILNKHKFVTRYVFYISVCMFSAYLESSIVAVFYFALTSEGSLNNLKLTALRTVAIGLTLKVSFSSSKHIVWKLNKYRVICLNTYFCVLFFCLLLHRLAVRISLPFHIFLQVELYLSRSTTGRSGTTHWFVAVDLLTF